MKEPSHYLTSARARRPLVHNITNYVAMNTMANVLLAVGASPAMVHAREEVAEFAAISDALTVNIGTADTAWYAAMEDAATVMARADRPWVLDPVGVGATRLRPVARPATNGHPGQRVRDHDPCRPRRGRARGGQWR